MKAVIDTNILVDYLLGKDKAKTEIELYQEPSISIITWMEVLVGAKNQEEIIALKNFLRGFHAEPVSSVIAEQAVAIRRETKILLPDAIIWATARVLKCILVTRNTRDFPEHHPSIRIPYKI